MQFNWMETHRTITGTTGVEQRERERFIHAKKWCEFSVSWKPKTIKCRPAAAAATPASVPQMAKRYMNAALILCTYYHRKSLAQTLWL